MIIVLRSSFINVHGEVDANSLRFSRRQTLRPSKKLDYANPALYNEFTCPKSWFVARGSHIVSACTVKKAEFQYIAFLYRALSLSTMVWDV